MNIIPKYSSFQDLLVSTVSTMSALGKTVKSSIRKSGTSIQDLNIVEEIPNGVMMTITDHFHGGTFVYDATVPKVNHNGVTVFDPLVDMSVWKYSSDADGTGVWLRVTDGIIKCGWSNNNLREMLIVASNDSLTWKDRNITITLSEKIKLILLKDLIIDCENVRIRRDFSAGGLDFTNDAEVLDVVNLTQIVSHSLPNSTTTSTMSTIECPGHSFKTGDIGKVISDDIVPKGTSAGLCGEFFQVADVVGSVIYTNSVLLETYLTNIKVAKPNTVRLVINGLNFQDDDLFATTGALRISGFIRAKVNCEFNNLGFVGFTPKSCYKAQVNVLVTNMQNSPDRYGYGVNDSSGYGNDIRVSGSNTRHHYTTNMGNAIPGAGDWKSHGRTIRSVITGTSEGGGGSYDTHPDALHCTFMNIIETGGNKSWNVAGASFQDRGSNTVFMNCRSINATSGFHFVNADNVKLINCSHVGNGSALLMDNSSMSGDLNIDTSAHVCISIRNSKVRLNLTGKLKSITSYPMLFWLSAGNDLDINLDIDASESIPTMLTVLRNGGLGNVVNITGSMTVPANSNYCRILNGGNIDIKLTMSKPLVLKGINSRAVSLFNITETSEVTLNYVAELNSTSLTNIDAFGTTPLTNFNNIGNDRYVVVVNVLESTGYILSDMNLGKYPGQELTIINNSLSLGNLTLSATGTNISIPSDVVLLPYESQKFIWTGSDWIAV